MEKEEEIMMYRGLGLIVCGGGGGVRSGFSPAAFEQVLVCLLTVWTVLTVPL